MKVKRVIITGGPSTGKTSIINKLEILGHKCFHEKSREIIQESLKENSDVLPWVNVDKFSERVIKKREAQFHKASRNDVSISGFTFYDRGIPDVFAYMEYDNAEIPREFYKLGEELRYHDTVFLTPAWKEIYVNDAERMEDFHKAQKLEQLIKNTYLDLDYNVVIVPKMNIEDRIKFILSHLE